MQFSAEERYIQVGAEKDIVKSNFLVVNGDFNCPNALNRDFRFSISKKDIFVFVWSGKVKKECFVIAHVSICAAVDNPFSEVFEDIGDFCFCCCIFMRDFVGGRWGEV